VLQAGLPDGLFSYQKSQFGYILDGLGMEIVGIFYEHFEYYMRIWYILRHIGIVCDHLVYFPPFEYDWTKKDLATLVASWLNLENLREWWPLTLRFRQQKKLNPIVNLAFLIKTRRNIKK
jgi:hypothetical protein